MLGRVRLGSIRNKNNWNNASKRLFGSYSHSGIPGFPFRLFYSQEQNSRNIFRNKFLFRNIPNERALSLESKVYIKYLGVLMDQNLFWKYHIDSTVTKNSKNVGLIAKLRHSVPRPILLNIYNSLIQPYLTYGLAAWGQARKNLS